MLMKWRKQSRKDRRLFKTWGSSSGRISQVSQWFTEGLPCNIFALIMSYLCKTPQCLPLSLLRSQARRPSEHSLSRQKMSLHIWDTKNLSGPKVSPPRTQRLRAWTVVGLPHHQRVPCGHFSLFHCALEGCSSWVSAELSVKDITQINTKGFCWCCCFQECLLGLCQTFTIHNYFALGNVLWPMLLLILTK